VDSRRQAPWISLRDNWMFLRRPLALALALAACLATPLTRPGAADSRHQSPWVAHRGHSMLPRPYQPPPAAGPEKWLCSEVDRSMQLRQSPALCPMLRLGAAGNCFHNPWFDPRDRWMPRRLSPAPYPMLRLGAAGNCFHSPWFDPRDHLTSRSLAPLPVAVCLLSLRSAAVKAAAENTRCLSGCKFHRPPCERAEASGERAPREYA